MRLYFLVEGKSEETFLKHWLPRFLPSHTSFLIITHRGKGKLPRENPMPKEPSRQGLLDQLPMKLRAYGKALSPDTARVIVLLDQDEDDCLELKSRIIDALACCNPRPETLVRIAVKETEAFYLGDKAAIRRAFHRSLHKKKLNEYQPDRHPESGTWEIFAKIVKATSEDKVGWARTMAENMAADRPYPNDNQSVSFRNFCLGVLKMAGEPTT